LEEYVYIISICMYGSCGQVLMRALRDFNIPKIVTDDLPVFLGLIGDLFPALEVPRKRDSMLETQIKTATTDLHLQPEDSFILKVFYMLLFVLNRSLRSNLTFHFHVVYFYTSKLQSGNSFILCEKAQNMT